MDLWHGAVREECTEQEAGQLALLIWEFVIKQRNEGDLGLTDVPEYRLFNN